MIYREFLQFIIAGGLAAIVNFFSRILLNHTFSFGTSIILAYLLGMIAAFFLMRIFVFKQTTSSYKKSLIFFILINILAILQTWVISFILFYLIFSKLNFNFYPKEIAHAVGILFPIITSYYGHRYLTFK